MKTKLPVAEMERAYLERDAGYDGVFFLAVKTTGIFCRPTCSARKPLPRNVEYFDSAPEALFAGYRPCQRCRPMDVDEQPAWARRLLAEIDAAPSIRITEAELRRRGIDPSTARRHFQRHFGMTFGAYMRARRLGHALRRIREGGRVDDVVFESGYESHSGFREAFQRVFGTAAGRARDGKCVQLAWVQSPLGPLIAGATEDGVCLLEFTDRRMLEAQLVTVRKVFGCPVVPGRSDVLAQLTAELAAYFEGKLRRFTVALRFPGTDFQRTVWEELQRIPYGTTCSYEDLALAIGRPNAQRAVGRANGLNRIAIVIPCHRVVNKDGGLGGYGGGLRRKQFLLELEGATLPVAARAKRRSGDLFSTQVFQAPTPGSR